MKRSIRAVALGVLCLLAAGCPKKLPPPQWAVVQRDRTLAVRRIAVLAGRYPSAVAGCVLGVTKAMVEAFHLARRYQVRAYRDVLIALERPDVDVNPEASALDPALAARLRDRLAVDAVVVLTMSQCGQATGEHVTVGLFATDDGTQLGTFQSGRPGIGDAGQYFATSNFQSIARETVDALERTLAGASAPL